MVKPREEVGVEVKERPKAESQIPKQYWDLQDVFNKNGSDEHHLTTTDYGKTARGYTT